MQTIAKHKLGKLHIKKRQVLHNLAYFIFIMPFFMAFLIDIVSVPSFVKYSIDLVWLVCIALLFMKSKLVLDRNMVAFLLFIIAFFCYVLFGYMLNYQSVFYFLWGFRNNFRFYIAFIIFAMLFDDSDADFCLKIMDVLFWVNIAASVVQYFVLGLKQDFLGGIFGTGRGCNAYSIVFFSIVISKSLIQYINKKESALLCFTKCGATLLIAAMAEIKYYFVVFAIVLFMATLLTSFSVRKLFIVLAGAILISIAGSVITELFGESHSISFEKIFEFATATNYSTEQDLSRYTAIPSLSNSIMRNNIERLFGLGIGNCDTSTFPICNTPFYQTYSYLHYTWLSSVFLFLETGIVGLCIYITFFIMCFVFAYKQKKRADTNTLYCQMAMIMSVICITLTFYNSSLRFEVAYMIYFVLALPLINSRSIKLSR